jgi:hypothetical protein
MGQLDSKSDAGATGSSVKKNDHVAFVTSQINSATGRGGSTNGSRQQS